MGKNSKVLLDNGKEAMSSMQLYWDKAKKIQKQKQEERKAEQKGNNEQKPKPSSGPRNDSNEYVGKDQMNAILNEKERRRQGNYSQMDISESSILQAQKALSNKTMKIPGYSSDFISKQQVDRNRRDIERRQAEAQQARERKEERERKQTEGAEAKKEGQTQPQQPPKPLVQPPSSQPPQQFRPPFPQQQQQQQQPRPNYPTPIVQQQQHQQYKRPPRIDNEVNDPFFKVTEQMNYDPVKERAQKQLELQQQQQQRLSQPPLPAGIPPPQIPSGQVPMQILPPLPNGIPPMYPPQFSMPPPIVATVPVVPVEVAPVVVEGESTVRKSKIDLTTNKQLFVPRGMISKPAASNVASQQPEALGGTIKNVSHAPAPQPFIKNPSSSIVSNPNNQDLLKTFMSDIETISMLGKLNN